MSVEREEEEQSGIATATNEEVKRPSLFKVIMHNDDYTTMEFVVYCLRNYFNKSDNDAEHIMMEIHTQGSGVCGIFTKEIAEAKSEKVMKEAEKEGFPLQCTVEEE